MGISQNTRQEQRLTHPAQAWGQHRIRASEEMTSNKVESKHTNTWIVCDLISNDKHLCSYSNQASRLTAPEMIPEQPLSINLPALHSTPRAQCQHVEESIDKEFDPGVICLHYTIFSRTMTFSLLSHHKTFKCSQVWQCEGRSPCEHVM